MVSDKVQLERYTDHANEHKDHVKTYSFGTVVDAQILHDKIRLAKEALADLSSENLTEAGNACQRLAALLCLRSQHEDDVDLMEESINFQRTALALCTRSSTYHAMSCGNLAVYLKMLYERIGDIRVLDEAIDLEREALDLSPAEDPDRLSSCMNLAASLKKQYERAGDIHCLNEAIDLQREALAFCSDRNLSRALPCGNLALSLMMLYERMGDFIFLDEAIGLGRETLHLCPLGDPNRSSACRDLAFSLKSRYAHTGDVRLLGEAIDLEREALGLRTEGQPNGSFYGNLARSLRMNYESTGNGHLLDEAIDLERQALHLRPAGHLDRLSSCEHLSILLNMRFNLIGDVRLLDEAIDLQREALAVGSERDPNYSMSCVNMAGLLATRYEHTGDTVLLEEAIDLARKALLCCCDGHSNRSMSRQSLAASLWMCYERTGDEGLLDQAIDLGREVLELRPAGDPKRLLTCGNLATFLITRYELTSDDRLMHEAILLQREALDLSPKGHPDHASSCGNLANLLCACYRSCGDEALLHEIYALEHEAVTIAPAQVVWSHLCNLAWVHLQTNSPFYDVNKAISFLSDSLKNEHDDNLAAVRQLQSLLHDLWDHNAEGKHIKLTAIYRRLVNLLPLLAHPALGIQPQLMAMRHSSYIGSDAFVNAALAGDSKLGLENLELTQGVIWSQNLHRRDPQLASVPELLSNRLQELLQAIGTGSVAKLHHKERTTRLPHDALHVSSSELYALVREIQALPGLDRFMLGETYESLCSVASKHPVVVLVGSRGHYYALIIASSLAQGHDLLALDMTDEDIKNLSFRPGTTNLRRGIDAPEGLELPLARLSLGKRTPTRTEHLNRYMKALWRKIVRPVLDHIGLKPSHGHVRPRLHWCPTGAFSSFPLHATGIYDGAHRVSCADYVISSYTPTVTTLLHAQRTSSPLSRERLSFALVAEKRAQDLTLLTIPGVNEEIDHVAAVIKSTAAVGNIYEQIGSTTVDGTADMMQKASIVHLACHGIQDSQDATQSGFCLGDGRLTIAKLTELRLDNAFLAFLSACETARGDKQQPDQAMHLAAAMLSTGFKSVVATMWAISDVDGPKVAKRFYEELLAKEVVDADSIAYALDSAVAQLRDSGVSADRWAPFIHMGA